MKTFKVIGATLVLALSLSMPAFADDNNNPGDAHTPGRTTLLTDDPPPVKTGSTDIATGVDDTDSVFLNIVLWALASIY